VRELVRRNLRWFILGTAAGLLLRLIFLIRFPAVVTDSFVYGDIAKNWLQHGIYGLSGPEEISATYIRLPGYPAFLACIFAIFGTEHYRTALIVQILVDLGTCLFCADIALRLLGPRCAKVAFLLAALCPFLADYSAAALTETLEVFFTAAALDFALAGFERDNLRLWTVCAIFCGAAILLRPDGALLLMVIVLYLAWQIAVPKAFLPNSRGKFAAATVLVICVSLLPLVPWTLRNWRLFHRFQPLAPRYANEESEFVPMGFNHWVKTWMADYTSVEEVYWPVPGSAIDGQQLPSRAFDSPQQHEATMKLIADYNDLLHISPELDLRFEALASQRIRAHPLRYYIELPGLRILDMWLRPRTETLPSDSRWWEFNDERKWSVLAVALGAINLGYLMCALVGWLRSRSVQWMELLILFVVLRSLFLGTLENPEPRYTLEMFPIVIILASVRGGLEVKTRDRDWVGGETTTFFSCNKRIKQVP
jgi:4-amino-4-deoxy-L-arabinose transferase-like glycosyltransferase